MSTPANNCSLHEAIIQRCIQIAISKAIFINFFLSRQYVHTSCRTGRRYTDEILRAHPRCVMKLVQMPIITFLDLRDWIEQRGLLSSTRHISVVEQLIMFLWIVGHEPSNEEIQDSEQFQHSGKCISQ